MAYSTLLYEKQRQGVLITLDRPEQMNALSAELREELHQAFDEAAADPEVRAIVLTGAGRAFSAGAAIGGDATETVWPYGLPEGTAVAAVPDGWPQARARRREAKSQGRQGGGPARRWCRPLVPLASGTRARCPCWSRAGRWSGTASGPRPRLGPVPAGAPRRRGGANRRGRGPA